jgi:hypothetical protein
MPSHYPDSKTPRPAADLCARLRVPQPLAVQHIRLDHRRSLWRSNVAMARMPKPSAKMRRKRPPETETRHALRAAAPALNFARRFKG